MTFSCIFSFVNDLMNMHFLCCVQTACWADADRCRSVGSDGVQHVPVVLRRQCQCSRHLPPHCWSHCLCHRIFWMLRSHQRKPLHGCHGEITIHYYYFFFLPKVSRIPQDLEKLL